MKKFTVLLQRPDYMDMSTYLAWVEASNIEVAIVMAQHQTYDVDGLEADGIGDPEDYAVLAVFEGHIDDVSCRVS